MEEKKYTLDDLVQVIRILRGENGCPWDRVQTHESIRQDMLEEAYEAADAIDKGNMENLCEELGDVLMQVVFHAEIEAEKGGFTIEDVIRGICEKMVYRHPHVFGNGEVQADTAEQVLVNWEELKKKEKHTETQTEVMKNVPDALPALIRARKVQKKAADVGFDFPDALGAIQKVYEEIQELEESVKLENGTEEEEFGDILFALVNISRFLKINPEFALTKAIKKFINRFEYIEKSALLQGKDLSGMTLEEMDLLWDEAKTKLRPMKL
ncbi:nucleoside triphosphate pyrophosphohydrolase [Anaerotignum sp.]